MYNLLDCLSRNWKNNDMHIFNHLTASKKVENISCLIVGLYMSLSSHKEHKLMICGSKNPSILKTKILKCRTNSISISAFNNCKTNLEWYQYDLKKN